MIPWCSYSASGKSLTEDEVNQIIDDVQASIRDLLRMPQRLARRTQEQVMSFEGALEDYLRNTEKRSPEPGRH